MLLEKIVLLKLKNGSVDAFSEIYKRYNNLIKQVCFFRCKNDDVADDLTQDTFIKLWNSRERIDVNRNFKYYLIEIAKNTYADYFRKKTKENIILVDYSELEKYESDSNNSLRDDEDDAFVKAKEVLDDESYEILVYHFVHGLKYREIALLMNLTTSTVTNKASRAIKLLKERWKL